MTESIAPDAGSLVFVIPIYNDWDAAQHLAADIDAVQLATPVRLFFVDDASQLPRPAPFGAGIQAEVNVLRLQTNLGHQKAIAVGLAYIQEHVPGVEAVVVMDGDGEDRPMDVPRLLEAFHTHDAQHIVFAERAKRTEGTRFKLMYRLYKGIHRVATGQGVKVGNFSVIPAQYLPSLVVMADVWIHYAAAVFKSKLPFVTVPADRGDRYAGKSKMNLSSLVVHGLSALSVYSERIGVRMLEGSAWVFGGLLLTLVGLVIASFVNPAIDAVWGIMLLSLAFVILLLFGLLALVFVFLTLGNRSRTTMLPIRDYTYFVAHCEVVGGA
ncbi:MAG: glycosyltransferase family 2 protein [Rhodothermales bacterium]